MLQILPYGPCLTNWERREQRYQQLKCQTTQNTFKDIQHPYKMWKEQVTKHKQYNPQQNSVRRWPNNVMNINYCFPERAESDRYRPLSTDTKTECGITAYPCSIQPLCHQSPKEHSHEKHMLRGTPHYSCNTCTWYLVVWCDTEFKEKLLKGFDYPLL